MSYRYCIGRHTIASVMHAETIAKLIHDNPDILSEERLAFTALDIRREINSKIWNNAINNVLGCDWDVYSAILYKSSEIENPYEVIYSVDDISKTIKITPGIVNDKFDKDYIDLIPWIKLANWIDKSCHKLLTCAWDNNVATEWCFPYPALINGKYVERYTMCRNFDKLSIQSYICPDYIIKGL